MYACVNVYMRECIYCNTHMFCYLVFGVLWNVFRMQHHPEMCFFSSGFRFPDFQIYGHAHSVAGLFIIYLVRNSRFN